MYLKYYIVGAGVVHHSHLCSSLFWHSALARTWYKRWAYGVCAEVFPRESFLKWESTIQLSFFSYPCSCTYFCKLQISTRVTLPVFMLGKWLRCLPQWFMLAQLYQDLALNESSPRGRWSLVSIRESTRPCWQRLSQWCIWPFPLLQTIPLGDCSWGHLLVKKEMEGCHCTVSLGKDFTSVSKIGFQMPPFLKQ